MAYVENDADIILALYALIVVIEIYLLFTNISYAILKEKHFVPSFLKNREILKRYRCTARLGHFSRTGYLVCVITYTGYYELLYRCYSWFDTSDPCFLVWLVPFTYLCVNLLCRLWFSWANSLWIKYCINLSSEWDSNLILFYTSLICVLFMSDLWVSYDALDGDCTNYYHNTVVLIIFMCWTMWELLSFLIFFLPLQRTTGVFSWSPSTYRASLLTTNQQLDEVENGQVEIVDSIGNTTPNHAVSQNSFVLVAKFQKYVRRNLFAGVLIMLMGILQCLLYLFVLGFTSNSVITQCRKDFRNVRLPIIILGITQYACMMLSESNWDRAFVPFCCWDRKSWTD